MEPKVHYTLIGAFVITLTSFIIIGIIWLSSGFSTEKYSTYQSYMSESVSGLNIDSAVEFNGVIVGTVSSIEIDPHNPNLVILLYSVKSTTPISQGTRATLKTKGLTGLAYVSLIDQGNDLTPLRIVHGEHYRIIQTKPSLLGGLDVMLPKILENIDTVSKSIQSLLSEKNVRSLTEILIDLRHVSRTLAMNTAQMNTILHNTAEASMQFTPLLLSGIDSMRTFNQQILPATNQLMMNLDFITRNLDEVSREMEENPAVIIRGKVQERLGPGEK